MGELDYAAENRDVEVIEQKRRTTKYDLAQKLKHFERTINSARRYHHAPDVADGTTIAYRLDYANGGVRVETIDESRTVSPRLTRRGLADWFDAALRALEEVTRG